MYALGEIHPKFNLLAFSGYDVETGEECWASLGLVGRDGALKFATECFERHGRALTPRAPDVD